MQVFRITPEIWRQVFPVMLDIDNPALPGGPRRLLRHFGERMRRARRPGRLVRRAQAHGACRRAPPRRLHGCFCCDRAAMRCRRQSAWRRPGEREPRCPYAVAALHGLLIWWFSTGADPFLDGLPRRTFRWSMTGGDLVLLALALWARRAADDQRRRRLLGFTCGVSSGPGWRSASTPATSPARDRRPARHGCPGWARFGCTPRGQPVSRARHSRLGALPSSRLTWKGAQRVRPVDLPRAVVDAPERPAQRLSRRAAT